jgi:transposase-like protein
MNTKPLNIKAFNRRFPDDDACLNHLMRTRYGVRFMCRCNREATYYRVKGRRCFECEHCGNQVYPTAGTPFESTRTSLKDWFFVMFLFCASRNGVAAKEVERQLGVTYKTAWRMCRLIREYMGHVDGDAPLGGDYPGSGIVEVDKAFIGGRDRQGKDDKSVVLGMVEREGEIITRVVADKSAESVVPHIVANVKAGSRVATDEARAFADLQREGFWHAAVNHSAKEYVRGDVHTNTIEAFWANFKRGIKGTYVHVSKKHLQAYLREFEYRHNLRRSPALMFEILVQAFSRPSFQPSLKGAGRTAA